MQILNTSKKKKKKKKKIPKWDERRKIRRFFSLMVSVFSIWKSLQVLRKAHIKIVAHAVFTYLFLTYVYTLLFCWKIKSCCDCCFPQQIIPQNTIQSYMLWDYPRVMIGVNINKCHTLPVAKSCLNPLSFDHYCFTQS